MQAEKTPGARLVPWAATALAVGYLASIAAPALLPAVVVAAAAAGCMLVLTRRPAPGLRLVLCGIGVWLGVGLVGAYLLRFRPLGGLAWIVVFLYAAPLPVIAWLYALTFPDDAEPSSAASGESSGDNDGAAR